MRCMGISHIYIDFSFERVELMVIVHEKKIGRAWGQILKNKMGDRKCNSVRHIRWRSKW